MLVWVAIGRKPIPRTGTSPPTCADRLPGGKAVPWLWWEMSVRGSPRGQPDQHEGGISVEHADHRANMRTAILRQLHRGQPWLPVQTCCSSYTLSSNWCPDVTNGGPSSSPQTRPLANGGKCSVTTSSPPRFSTGSSTIATSSASPDRVIGSKTGSSPRQTTPPAPTTPARDDDRDDARCPTCGLTFPRSGRQRLCSHACRQRAFRRRQPRPDPPPSTRRTTPPRGLGLRLPKLRHSLQRATTLRRRQHLVHPPRHRRRLPEPWGTRHHRRTPRSRHGMIYRHVSSYTDRHVSSYADTRQAVGRPRRRRRPAAPSPALSCWREG